MRQSHTDPFFVVQQAGAGGYFSTGSPVSHHKSRAEADAAPREPDAEAARLLAAADLLFADFE